MAEIDALISLAIVSKENNMVRPVILNNNQEPIMKIK
jgi:DNA mismatch repair ATPase MutS